MIGCLRCRVNGPYFSWYVPLATSARTSLPSNSLSTPATRFTPLSESVLPMNRARVPPSGMACFTIRPTSLPAS